MAGPRLGVLVNPIAGLGGRVGLKGTDGADTVARALALGARPRAAERMAEALVTLRARAPGIAIVDAGHGAVSLGTTRAADTEAWARTLRDAGVDLILFAGGDGTARDILHAIDRDVPILGVPAGVKMHSAVFAASPRAAAALAVDFLEGRAETAELEVMDLDEDAYRAGRVSPRLHGYARAPYRRDLIQGAKVGGVAGDAAAVHGAAAAVARRVRPGTLAILGPGTTMAAVAAALGVPKTLLGVDLVRDGRVLRADVAEADILSALEDAPDALVVVAPIGGQGHILGRGNQQISPAVLARAGTDALIVVATPAKLASLHDQALRVDTGDAELDRRLAGWRRVVTGAATEAVCRVL